MGALSPPVTARGRTLGKLSYGLLFTLALPAGAVSWAIATEDVVRLPGVHAPVLGDMLLAAGAAVIALAVRALWVRGGGLPMNPFPPPRRVEDGIYRFVSHPIYLGTTAVALGASLRSGSASGLWLVTPLLTLSWAALVWGYEAHDLRQRFGAPHPTWFSFPPDTPGAPHPGQRLTVLLSVLGPVLVASLLPWVSVPGLLGETRWLALLRASPLAGMAVAIVLVRPAGSLRRLALRALLGLALALGASFALPSAGRAPGDWVAALLVAWIWMIPGWPAKAWAVLVTAAWGPILGACGVLLALLAQPIELWEALRLAAERVANSLRLWNAGPVRVSSGAAISFVAATAMLSVASTLAGPGATLALGVGAVLGVVCSALWAQLIEGGHALSRPFGFYGTVVGLLLGALLAPLTGSSAALVLAAYAASGPVFMVPGRLRCLQQGCCHGAPADPQVGIRYRHPLSRVTTRTPWRDVPLHPTPLYSSIWHLVIVVVVLRLWGDGAALGLITGLTFILSGLGRFVEESFRGEPQTPIHFGLRLYQHLALVSVAAGVALTVFGSRTPAPVPEFSPGGLVMAVLVSLFIAFATGVDFPRSSRRFSRLV